VPVINALTDMYHPCQLLADIQTFIEHRGAIHGRTVAWVGDGNNVCHSWMNAARQFGFTLRLATPKGYEPNAALLTACAAHVQPVATPAEAVRAADVVVTDTWASMGQEDEKAQRLKDFAGFRVDAPLMKLAHKDALFMHCLPAYRGMEVDAAVIDGPQSVVWDEAENRLHAQKALLEFLLVTR
jgi:ornithine carbamoyltransferase